LKIAKQFTNRESQSLDKYLQEIGKVDLLSPEDEIQLAIRIRKGDRSAFEQLTKANLRFVVSVAKQYQNQGLSLEDLINEGNLGLIKAATRFDETRGFKFISYAVWWIRQRQNAYLTEHVHMIAVPESQRNKRKREFLKTLPEDAVEHGMVQRHGLKALRIETEAETVSMDSPSHGSSKLTYMDSLADTVDADQSIAELIEVIPKILSKLDPVDAKVISDYYGLQTGIKKTYAEIGLETGRSRERIRQIMQRAHSRFKHALNRMGDVDKTDLEVFR